MSKWKNLSNLHIEGCVSPIPESRVFSVCKQWIIFCNQKHVGLLWYAGPIVAISNIFGTKDQLHGRKFFYGAGVYEQRGIAVNKVETSLTCLPLICCVAWLLTGHGLVLIHGLKVGDHCPREYPGQAACPWESGSIPWLPSTLMQSNSSLPSFHLLGELKLQG